MQKNFSSRIPISKWNPLDRPREKMLAHSPAQLSDAELLSIIIGSGTKGQSALDVSQGILYGVQYDLGRLCAQSPQQLAEKYKGIGQAKAVSILACLELGRRYRAPRHVDGVPVQSSEDAFKAFYLDLAHAPYEKFQVLLLSTANRVIKKISISEGGLASTMVDPKKIFQMALEHHAAFLILGHNHPSRNLKPSPQDIALTRRIWEIGESLDMKVLDHLILGGEYYYSFADHDKIPLSS